MNVNFSLVPHKVHGVAALVAIARFKQWTWLLRLEECHLATLQHKEVFPGIMHHKPTGFLLQAGGEPSQKGLEHKPQHLWWFSVLFEDGSVQKWFRKLVGFKKYYLYVRKIQSWPFSSEMVLHFIWPTPEFKCARIYHWLFSIRWNHLPA